ncbi:MAG: acyl-CoA dehydrogenase family protein [Tropicimonas sp.]|uniref:acyl-CoA dehydrogenase family protein n=1 Tax=Tropicimonas sp. TaxID=2067044 RepID=UPI003A88F597
MNMHVTWSAEEVEYREAIARAAPRILGTLSQADGSQFLPMQAWRELAETGLFALPFAPEDGGLGVRLSAVMHVFETLGMGLPDAGFTFSACTHLCALGLPLARFGSAEAREALLPGVIGGGLIGAHAISEADAGSAAFEMRTTGRRVDGGWELDGEKHFVSNGPVAGMIAVYARTTPEADALSGFSAFLVPADSPGLTRGIPTPKIGLKTSPFGTLFLDRVFVPDHMVLGAPGRGFAVLDYVMKREILITFAAHLGQMQRRFDGLRNHVRTRKQGGQRISAHQSVSNRVVDDFIKLETARMWLYRAGAEIDAGRGAAREVAIAKLLVAEANLDVALDAVRLHGAAGYLDEADMGTEVADALGGVIYSGSSEIQRNRIAATLGL